MGRDPSPLPGTAGLNCQRHPPYHERASLSSGEPMSLSIHYFGLLKSPASWAAVGRETALALGRLGCDVTATGCRGFLFDPKFPLPSDLRRMLDRPSRGDVVLAFEYPLNYWKLEGRLKVGMIVYETPPLPAKWVEAIRQHLDLLLVPSRFCRDIVLASGVPASLVRTVPYGHDPAVFHPGRRPLDRIVSEAFTFLHIAMPHRRKGTDLLVRAFVRTFSRRDPVRLLIKTTYRPPPPGRRRPWEGADLADIVEEALSSRTDPPRIDLIVSKEPPEAMGGYFAACDCYVQPSGSEGFGLAVLEAMACEKPVIVTGYGGHLDFCREGAAYRIDFTLGPAGSSQYDHEDPGARIAVPDEEHLAVLMRQVFENPSEAAAVAAAGRRAAAPMCWEAAAKQILRRIEELP